MPSAADESAGAREWLHASVRPNTSALEAAIADARADGYASGALALAAEEDVAALGVLATGEAEYGSIKQYWDDWKPGDVRASELLDNGGFKSLLDDAGVTVQGIADTTLDRMGTLLADGAAKGLSVDELADQLHSLVNDPNRAYSIANTELARATSAATADTFEENGIEQWEWLVSDGACDECEAEADSGPRSLGDDQPPLHPSCRCAMTPVPGSYRAPEPRADEDVPDDQPHLGSSAEDSEPLGVDEHIEGDEALDSLPSDLADGLSKRDAGIPTEYQYSSQVLNDSLRGKGDPYPSLYARELIEDSKRVLDDLLERSRTTQPIKVFRGFRSPPADLRVGSSFVDKGFVSTTADRNVTLDFLNAGNSNETDAVMELRLPTGSRALNMNGLPNHVERYEYQKEILLPRGQEYRITGMRREVLTDSFGDTKEVTIYEAELV